MARKTIIREMRGIPYFLLVEYLEEMGGTQVEEGIIQAEDWTVHLEKMQPFKIGSLRVGQSRLTIFVEEEAEADFISQFSMKTLRAGG